MNRNHWIDQCPACQELLWQFYIKKSFTPEDPDRAGWSGVSGYFCAGCDGLLIAVGFTQEDRDLLWVKRSPLGEFEIPVAPEGRGHPCYLPSAVRSAAAAHARLFEGLRRVREEIGPRRQPDEPRLTLALSSGSEVHAIADTFASWLANSDCGRVTSQEQGSEEWLVHFEVNNSSLATHTVERLVSKFKLAGVVKLYGYNEGRRYRLAHELQST